MTDGFKDVLDLDCDTTVALGGVDKKGKKNPTSLEGYYLGSKLVDSAMSKTGKAYIHVFQTATGNVGIWGKTDLDRKMLAATTGALTRVSFTGMQENPKPGKKPMYKYRVQINAGNVIDTTALATGNASSEDLGTYDDAGGNEDDLFDDEQPLDEVPPARPEPLRRTASAPPKSRAEVEALLKRRTS